MFDEDYKLNLIPEDVAQNIAELVAEIISKMGISSKVSTEDNLKGKTFNISSPDSNLLIGQRGLNLYALQTLVQNIAYKRWQVSQRFTIDVDDYKKKREWHLREVAKKAIEHVKRTNRPAMLEPMPAYERRVIHAYLSEENSIEAQSVGVDPNRRIVIKPKQKGSI